MYLIYDTKPSNIKEPLVFTDVQGTGACTLIIFGEIGNLK